MQTALNLLKARKCIVITHEMNEDDLFIRHLVRPDNPVSEKLCMELICNSKYIYEGNIIETLHLCVILLCNEVAVVDGGRTMCRTLTSERTVQARIPICG